MKFREIKGLLVTAAVATSKFTQPSTDKKQRDVCLPNINGPFTTNPICKAVYHKPKRIIPKLPVQTNPQEPNQGTPNHWWESRSNVANLQ